MLCLYHVTAKAHPLSGMALSGLLLHARMWRFVSRVTLLRVQHGNEAVPELYEIDVINVI